MQSAAPIDAAASAQALYHPGAGWERRFWLIFAGQSLSLLGSALTQFVLLWWIADTTGSVSALAGAGAAALLPLALLSPLAGTFADRYSRRMLMIAADTISAACMVLLIVLFLGGGIALWHIYHMMFARSAMQAFQMPAAAASVAMLVPASFLPRAAGLNQIMQSVTMIALAPLGALAMGVMPLGWALAIDAVTALAGIVPLLVLRIPQSFAAPGQQAGLWSECRAGAAMIWSNPGLRRLYGLIGLMMLIIMPSLVLVALLVKQHFGGGAGQVALMEALSGVGLLGGGIVVAVLAPQRQVPWILWGFAATCLALALTGLTPGTMFYAALVAWTLCGLACAAGNASLMALLQAGIPNQMQGRAFSLLDAVIGLGAPVGLALGAPLGELIGIRALFVLAGVLGTLVCLAGFFSPALMRLDGAPAAAPLPAGGTRP